MTINGGGLCPPPTLPKKNFCRFGGNGGDPSLRSGRHFVSVGKGVPFSLCVILRSASDEGSPPFNRGGEKTLLETPPEEK